METRDYLARQHREVVDEFICAVVEEWAETLGDLERNVLGADAETLGRIPEWLDAVQTPVTFDRDFFEEMGRLLDPTGYEVLEESLGLLPASRRSPEPLQTACGA